MENLKKELKELIIESLALENTTSGDIGNDTILFGDGLGLDSIDALELGIALRKKYGIKMDANTRDIKKHFDSVNSLSLFVNEQLQA